MMRNDLERAHNRQQGRNEGITRCGRNTQMVCRKEKKIYCYLLVKEEEGRRPRQGRGSHETM